VPAAWYGGGLEDASGSRPANRTSNDAPVGFHFRAAPGTSVPAAACRLSGRSPLWRASNEGFCPIVEVRKRATVSRSWTANTAQDERSFTIHMQHRVDGPLTRLIAAVNCLCSGGQRPVALLHHGWAVRGIVTGMRSPAAVEAAKNLRNRGAWCVFLAKSTLCLRFFRHDLSGGQGKVMGQHE